MRQYRQPPGERPNHVRDLSDMAYEAVQGAWDLGYAPLLTNFERYDDGSADLHPHIRIVGVGRELDGHQFCAVLTKEIGHLLDRRVASVSDSDNGSLIETAGDRDQIPVLVGVVPAPNQGHAGKVSGVQAVFAAKVDNALFRRLEGLQCLDECQNVVREPRGHLRPSFPVLVVQRCPGSVVRLSIDDGKAGLPTPVVGNAGDNDVVERRPDVVDHISHDDRKHLVGLGGELQLELPDVALAVARVDRPIWVGIGESSNLGVHLFEMMLCPIELENPGISHD